MLAKLLNLLATAKGATAAAVIVTAAAGTTVAVTNPDVQSAIQQTVSQSSPKTAECTAKPEVVSTRNEIDAKLRATFQKDQNALEQLRQTQVDNSKRATLNDLVKDTDAKLRAAYQTGLDQVGAATLGRNGHETPAPAAAASPATPTPAVAAPASPATESKCGSETKAAFTADSLAAANKALSDAQKAMDDAVSAATKSASSLATTPAATPTRGRPTESGAPASVPPSGHP